jgi:Protein kinase domain
MHAPIAPPTQSYGTVCAAVHRETGEVVAVKQIPRSAVSAKEVMSEVEILRVAGEHRHVIQLTDLFWDDELWYVVMEMAKGGELFDRIVTKGLLSEHETSQVMQDLLHAIEVSSHDEQHLQLRMKASTFATLVSIRIRHDCQRWCFKALYMVICSDGFCYACACIILLFLPVRAVLAHAQHHPRRHQAREHLHSRGQQYY